jgi:hypothetical protein
MQSFAGAAAFVDARSTHLAYPSSRRTPPVWSPPRRVVVNARVPCWPRRSQACTPARVRRSIEGKAGPLAPFSCLRRHSPPCLGRPRRRDPAVALWDAPTVAKRKERHVPGRRFLTHVLAPECGRLVHRAHGVRPGSAVHSAAPPLFGRRQTRARVAHPARAHPGARPCARIHAPLLERAHAPLLSAATAPASPRPLLRRPHRERRRPYRARPVE